MERYDTDHRHRTGLLGSDHSENPQRRLFYLEIKI